LSGVGLSHQSCRSEEANHRQQRKKGRFHRVCFQYDAYAERLLQFNGNFSAFSPSLWPFILLWQRMCGWKK
jgi:hypothetical protein